MFQTQNAGKIHKAVVTKIHKAVVTTKGLLTACWTSDVEEIEAAIGRFTADRALTTDCRVALFEIEGDRHLHVNVTHQHATKGSKGWMGPAVLPDGFVHNRLFVNGSPDVIVRHIRDMVFAPRV